MFRNRPSVAWNMEGGGGGLESSMATSRSRNVAVTLKRQKEFSANTLVSSQSTFHSNCAIYFFTDSPMTIVRLLTKNISRGRKPVADEGIPAYSSQHDSSATICPRQLVFTITHV